MTTICIDNPYTSPEWNLAAEEYLLTSFIDTVIMLWRNGPSVIIGKNQDAQMEVSLGEARQAGVPVVRRQTGGGAVYHDLGNLNYTYITSCTDDYKPDYAPFAEPIIAALAKLDIHAELSGRNDITVDGLKISGCANVIKNGRVLYHCTLLFDTQLHKMDDLLIYSEEKYKWRGVRSVASRVENLSNYLPDMDIDGFMCHMRTHLFKTGITYVFSQDDIRKIDRLKEEKYMSLA